MKFAISGFLILAMLMNTVGATAVASNAEIMEYMPALSMNPEYVRELNASYGAVDIDSLRAVTPVLTMNDGDFLKSLNDQFNPHGRKRISSEIETFSRRLEWALKLTRNGYIEPAESEFDAAVLELVKLNIDLYRDSKDVKTASRQILQFTHRLNTHLGDNITALKPSERLRLEGFKEVIREKLDTPIAHQRIRQQLLSRSAGNTGIFFLSAFSPFITLAALHKHVGDGFQRVVDSSLPPWAQFAVLMTSIITLVSADMILAVRLGKMTEVYNRLYNRSVRPETLSAVANSCSSIFK